MDAAVMQEESTHVVKGRRTKRHRLQQPGVMYSPSMAGADENMNNTSNVPSPATSTGSTTEEEEDMANCLILLAQGGGRDWPRGDDGSGRRLAEGKVGVYVYECKTCNRCFPSFQALGGHRASHKKPKVTAASGVEDENESNCLSLQLGKTVVAAESGNKAKVHECSICGSEFSSGQALGGHMRRHRPAVAMTIESSSQDSKKQKSILSLDLNLPAPAEDDRDYQKPQQTRFDFAGKQAMVLTATPLVDCHY